MVDDMTEIRNALKNDTIIIGKDVVMKELNKGSLMKVYLASNISPKIEAEMNKYAELVDVPVVKLSLPNDEVKIICKKQFLISVLAIRK